MQVRLGRFDDNKVCEVNEGMSVASALRVNGFTKQDGEVIQTLGGEELDGSEEVKVGQEYLLVQRTKSGDKQ